MLFRSGVGIAALYFIGLSVLGKDAVSVGTFIAFGTYIGMFWNPIMNLSNFYMAGAVPSKIDSLPMISEGKNGYQYGHDMLHDGLGKDTA